jgi:hypothetical protein
MAQGVENKLVTGTFDYPCACFISEITELCSIKFMPNPRFLPFKKLKSKFGNFLRKAPLYKKQTKWTTQR